MIWSAPASKLSAEFGISDVAIAKRCKKLNVPRPARQDRDAQTGGALDEKAETYGFSAVQGGVVADNGAADRWRVRRGTVEVLREIAGGAPPGRRAVPRAGGRASPAGIPNLSRASLPAGLMALARLESVLSTAC